MEHKLQPIQSIFQKPDCWLPLYPSSPAVLICACIATTRLNARFEAFIHLNAYGAPPLNLSASSIITQRLTAFQTASRPSIANVQPIQRQQLIHPCVMVENRDWGDNDMAYTGRKGTKWIERRRKQNRQGGNRLEWRRGKEIKWLF